MNEFELTPRDPSPNTAGMGSHHSASAKTQVWLTPPHIVMALGKFDLDPCAAVDQPWRTAESQYTIENNGFDTPWYGRVWLNPPYDQAGAWLELLANHGNGIALVFARTETLAWSNFVWPHASAVRFLKGRLNFHFPNGTRSPTNAGAPSALIAYGENNVSCLGSVPGTTVRVAA